jgi:hypothetical protein
MQRLWTIMVASFLVVSCNTSDDEAFKKGGGTEVKPQALGAVDSSANGTAGKPAVKAQYDLKVIAGASVPCRGTIEFVIMSDFKFELPDAKLKCLGLTIDLGKMLTQVSQEQTTKPEIESDGRVLRIDRMGDAVFTPKRPLILGPVIQDTTKYRNFAEEKDYSVVVTDSQTGSTSSGTGRIRLAVIGIDEKFPTEKYPDDFTKVLHWEMSTTGFEGVPVGKAFLFDKMEFWWNTRPIMMPKLVIEGSIKDFISGSPMGGGGAGGGGVLGTVADALFGKIRIELTVKNYESL